MLARLGRQPVWLLSDRTFDCLVVKHTRLRTLPARVLSWFRALTPSCDVIIWLQVEPAVAAGRDREFDPAYYDDMTRYYQAAAHRRGWVVVAVAADTSPRTIAGEIGKQIGIADAGCARHSQRDHV